LGWLEYLRAHGVTLGIGDDLRVISLLDVLRIQRIALPDHTATARWLGPVLCRNADQQAQLLELLRGYAASIEPPTLLPPPPPPSDIRRALVANRALKWAVLIGTGLAGILLAVIAILRMLSTQGAPPLQPAPVGTQIAGQTSFPLFSEVAVALLPLVIAAGLVVFRRWRRGVLRRGLAPADVTASVFNIQVTGQQLFRHEALRPTIADLRRHRSVPAEGFDVSASIRATIAAAGFVTLVPARRLASPEYLLLVDRAGRDDHLDIMGDLLMARLQAGQVAVERYNFQGDPRRVRFAGTAKGLHQRVAKLDELHSTHPDHRLLVLCDTGVFDDPTTGDFFSWVEDLLWREAAVLTPLRATMWGHRERALIRRGFAVSDMTPPGIASLARQLLEHLPQDRATPGSGLPTTLDQRLSVDPYLWLSDASPPESVVRGLIADLKVALGQSGFFWLSALAVFPAMHPKLTLALGGILADADGSAVLSEDRMALLSRLPWSRRSRMPDWLRLALVRDLDQHGEDADRARAAWTYLLSAVAAGRTETVPIQVVQQTTAGVPALIASLLRDRSEYQEAILLSFLNRKKLPLLSMELPAQLSRVMRDRIRWHDLGALTAGAVLTGVLAVYGVKVDQAAADAWHGTIGAVQNVLSLPVLLAITILSLALLALTVFIMAAVRSGLSIQENKAQLRRAVIASTIGTTIEWYDFLLYGTMTALVFGKLFFPKSDPIVGTLEAFSVFFVGFVGRPIGAFIFGHWGDRIGRKPTLIVTLLVTGVATVAVGCVPGYASIGIWSAVLLTIIRLIQGIAVGGEWGGSVLLAVEWATNKNRGFISSWPQFGAPAGLFLANIAVLFFSWLSGDQFLVWGWRIPFFLSAIMVVVGLWIRLGILETPVFQRVLKEGRAERVPALEVWRRQPKQIILTALLRLPEQAPGYIVGAWIFTYATGVLGFSRDFVLLGVISQTVLGFLWVVCAGSLSDIVGRKNMYIIGCVCMGVFGFIYIAMLNSGVPWIVFTAIAISLLPVMTQYGPEAALIAENFTPRLRYSGSSIGYQLASVVAGGPAPFIVTALFATFGSAWPIAYYILACAIIGIIATSLLTDYTNREISTEYERV
jgi:MFS family permease